MRATFLPDEFPLLILVLTMISVVNIFKYHILTYAQCTEDTFCKRGYITFRIEILHKLVQHVTTAVTIS